ncbi:MAG TPA: hypothetical protein VMM83_01470 [Longimicrobiales bacterium]|nr:hypothetical protein [Longimicrobiales bacterium]
MTDFRTGSGPQTHASGLGAPESASDARPRRRPLALGRALAALGGILSVVFVGLEVRQNTRAVRGATYQAVAEAHNEWVGMVILNPDLAALQSRWLAGDSTLTAGQIGRVRFLLLYRWRTLEAAHFQVVLGNLPEEAFRRFLPPDIHEHPVISEWWYSVRDRFTDAFVAYVETMASADPRP